MKISELKNKRVTIMGLGLHGGGLGAAKFMAEHGAKLIITDMKTAKELKPSLASLKKFPNIKYVLGKHEIEDFIKSDLIIQNPAVPESSSFLEVARKNNIPIESDISLFFKWCPAEIIGITGTKGKSTTASLCYFLLKQKFKNVFLAGNIRASVLQTLSLINKSAKVVLELSSWQLHSLLSLKKSPHIALITNIMPDHLNRYKNMSEYINDKKIIFNFQDKKDILFLNKQDNYSTLLSKEAKSKIKYFNQKGEIKEIPDFKNLPGKHNKENILAALTIIDLFNIPRKKSLEYLEKFKGLEGRMEFIGKKSEITFINDTCATTPEATTKALDILPEKKIILIAGGTDKNLKFDFLSKKIAKKTKALILLDGTATVKIIHKLKNKKTNIPIETVDNMEKAVKKSFSLAQEGDFVLLSPACASFGLFKHEFDRGEKFKKSFKNLPKNH